jgi:DNA polymerase-1
MNFQNIPRSDKTIKRAFLPKLDYLVFFDYSQIEYRLLAYFMAAAMGDFTMAENFKKGLDPHTATACLMLGISPEDITDDDRQVGKTGNFSIMYAGGIPTIMRQLGCSPARAKELLNALHRSMPGIKQLQKEIIKTCKERGYIMSIAGRHLTPDPKAIESKGLSRAESALLNYLVQGSAAELMRDALRNVHTQLRAEGMASHIVNVVHDELAIDAPAEELDTLTHVVPTYMGSELVEAIVPIAVDTELSGESWADKEKYDPERASRG